MRMIRDHPHFQNSSDLHNHTDDQNGGFLQQANSLKSEHCYCHQPRESHLVTVGLRVTWSSTGVAFILTNGVEAVNVEAGWTPVSYVDLLQAVVRAVDQRELHIHHARLV